MKHVMFAICSLFVICRTYAMPATVDYVYDGDTFSAIAHIDKNTDANVRVRLINVDTPEIHGACEYETRRANAARERLMKLIPRGTVVELKNIKDDKYVGRIDANVILSDGRDVGNILIREKFGRAYNGGKRAGWCE